MKLLQKLLIISLIIIYGYSQSVFSHLEIIDSHHVSESTSTRLGCSDVVCQQLCESIEYVKITLTNSSKELLTKHTYNQNNDHYRIYYTPLKGYKYAIYNTTSPPVAIYSLVRRIGPIVRII